MEAEARISSLSLLVSIIDRPAEALAQVARTPHLRWIWPTSLCMASIVAFLAVAAPHLVQMAREAAVLQLSFMSAEQAIAAQEQMERFMTLPMIAGGSAINSLLGTGVGWLIAAALLYFGCLIAGEDLTFGQVFAIMPWLWLPFALQGFVQAAWVGFTGTLITTPGLSGLVATGNPLEDARNLNFALLSRVDLFALWHVVLVYAGLRGLTEIGAGKAIGLTAIYAALSLVVHLIPVLIGRAFAFSG